ncbi:MAG: hypothetical protein KDK64_05115 [Chlamydiia bacterium]|nr:hypothetical protein [Chlamydiia bacterium]
MTITKIFQTSGDLLQFVLPTVVGVQDVAPDVQQGKYDKAGEKALKILVLIGVQRYSCKLIKKLAKKKRPDGSDFESFPSGHFMIGAQCLARSCHRDGFPSVMAILVLMGTLTIGLGRYLPKKHDVVDLTAGGILGMGLGILWNHWLNPGVPLVLPLQQN